jgi:hypothetical protein
MKALVGWVVLVTLLFMFAENSLGQSQVSAQAVVRAPEAPLLQEAALVATLDEIQGEVQISAEKDAALVPAKNGDILHVLGKIKTGPDGRVRLSLSSGTIIRVANSSMFTFQSNEAASQGGLLTSLKLEIGKLWIILNGGGLDVDTPTGVAAVRGSYMGVSVDPVTKRIRITCLEGNCSWPNAQINLISGQALSLVYDPATGKVTALEQNLMTQAELDEWLANNPEAKKILPSAFATMTAMPAQPPAPGGTVPTPLAFANGTFRGRRVFSLGTVQVTIPDEKSGIVQSSRLSARKFSPALQGNLTYLTDAVQVQTEFPAPVQICFAHPPSKLQVNIYQLQGSVWTAVPSVVQNYLMCSSVPSGIYILAQK